MKTVQISKLLAMLGKEADDSAPGEEALFRARWFTARRFQISMFGYLIGILFHGISLFTDFIFVKDQEYRSLLTIVHLTYLLSSPVVLFAMRKQKVVFPIISIFFQLITVAPYLYFLHDLIPVGSLINMAIVRSWTAYLTLCVFLVIMNPFSGRLGYFYAAFLWAPTFGPWLNLQEGSVMIGLSALAYFGAAFFHQGLLWQADRECKREFRARRTISELERQKLDEELSLARQIQDSLRSPRKLAIGRLEAHCYQKKHEKVGGDWVGMRKDKDDAIVIAVADAAGKGLKAALIVHALQSLWAEALDYDNFQADKWIGRVNKTLFRLGEREFHAMSLGLVVLSKNRLTYWSAGHLPLYAVYKGPGGEQIVKAITAKGSLLGLNLDLELRPASFFFAHLNELNVFLGTDGVFAKGTRHGRRDLMALSNSMQLDCLATIEALPAADDKSLVWIQMGTAS